MHHGHVIEIAGREDTFEPAWKSARPNGIVTIVILYDKQQVLSLPDMSGNNLIFRTGGVDASDSQRFFCSFSSRI